MRPKFNMVYVLFFLSGISALIYQVIWVRQFGIIFGKTVYSASIVTAVFMCGLGIGSYFAGKWADHRYQKNPNSLLKTYAFFEIGIGLIGGLLEFVLPRLEPLSAKFSHYVTTDHGWHTLSLSSQIIPYFIAITLLLPITTLMGGTLTLLIRHLVRKDLSVTGRRIGTLYGLNTAGAAAGAFLVDFSLVPIIGLSGAQMVAIVINLSVGAAAWLWATSKSEMEPQTLAPQKEVAQYEDCNNASLLRTTGLAIFLSGFAGMGLEILWFRYLISALGSNRATFSLLLTVILVGMWLGSILCHRVQKRFGDPAIVFMSAQSLLAVTALMLFYFFDPTSLPASGLYDCYMSSPSVLQPLIEAWAKLRIILAVVGPPAFLMGFAYPLANINVQRAEASVGARAGVLYLTNTLGAVSGALVTGFFFLPLLGMQQTLVFLAICSVATALPLEISLRGRNIVHRHILASRFLVGLAGASIVASMFLPSDFLAMRLYRPQSESETLVSLSEGIGETIWITAESAEGGYNLYTNGHPMSGTSYEAQRYMRAFVHIPMLQMESAKDVLVICFGVGNTAHAASLYPSVKHIDIVDLSRHVLDQAGFFTTWNRNVLSDPRVAVHINDGRHHLRMQTPLSYDLITLEPPPINQAGVASLYSTEFYQLARSRLKNGGFLTQWLPAYQVPDDVCAAIVGAFITVFPDAIMLSGFKSEFILMGRRGEAPLISPAAINDHLRTLPAVRADLQAIDLNSVTEIVGSFAGSANSLRRTAQSMPPVTDDFPIMEYSMVTFRDASAPAGLFDVDDVDQWCPACFLDGHAIEDAAALPLYLEALRSYYASLTNQSLECAQGTTLTYVALDDITFTELKRRFPYLQWLYGPPEQ